MKIHLEQLPHQEEALNAIVKHFPELDENTNDPDRNYIYANPIIQNRGIEDKFIDIKMETGTGKTYVYTRTIFELHKLYGHNKFIIIVPSLAIKEGTKNFIESDYARQHFSKFYPNQNIELQLINSGDFAKKKGRYQFSGGLLQFLEGTRNEKNTIQVLLISDKGFVDKQTSSLFKDHYDQSLISSVNCPADAIKATRPIVIIDEPHRLKRDGSSYQNIINRFNPQSIIRFGATFGTRKISTGRNAKTVTDYFQGGNNPQPQFELGAVEAFSQDLVKGVSVQFPALNEDTEQYKVKSVTAKQLILQRVGTNNEWTLNIGDDLANTGGSFDGSLTFETSKKLSNELELNEGMILTAGVFANTYQELLIKQAIDAHFEKEIENFHRPENSSGYRVKTNCLFFIDSIASYRDKDENGNPTGWLRQTFETALTSKIEDLLRNNDLSEEYKKFLKATKNDISASHGGYFAKDWGESDESSIKEEVQDILHKERTLPFKKVIGKNNDGTDKEIWNTRRFFFSKWTLREGWDNPNVFTICKLRSSGSENSKIQEVGRGLRLPVDEQGNRLQGEEWRLNFIIDFSERDFAEKLIGEINKDAKIVLNTEKLTDEMIDIIVKNSNITTNDLLQKLTNDLKIIDFARDFQQDIEIDGETKSGYDWLIYFYPELETSTQLKSGKIQTQGQAAKRPPVKLRKDNWEKVKDVWQELSKRYLLVLEKLEKNEIERLFEECLNGDAIFDDNQNLTLTVQNTQTNPETDELELINETRTIENIGNIGVLEYNEFVKRLNKRTSIPVQIIHAKLWVRLQNFANNDETKEQINQKINTNTLEKIVQIWREKFAETFATKYVYQPLDYTTSTSVLKDGSFITEISAGDVGVNPANDVADDTRNLYEKPTGYDSEIEHEVEKITPPPKITVFGKIPRRAIKVPTYTGGTTTPDFMFYAENTEDENNSKLTILVETKAQDMRGAEKRAVEAQQKLFQNIEGVEWKLAKSVQDVQNALNNLQ